MAPGGLRDRIRRKFRRDDGGQATAKPRRLSDPPNQTEPQQTSHLRSPATSSRCLYQTDPSRAQEGPRAETKKLCSSACRLRTATLDLEDPSEDSTALWARAFRRFREHEPETLSASREEMQWKLNLRRKSVNIRRQVEKLAKFLVWSDGVVKTALVTVSTDLNDAMLEGHELINRIQLFWKMYEDSTSSNTISKAKDFLDLADKLHLKIIESIKAAENAWIKPTGHREEVQRCVDAQLREIQQSRDILQNISDILDETRRQYDDNTEREVLEQLFADHETYKNSLNPPRVEGTCEWFFQDKRFLDWRDSDGSRLLMVLAGPGSGKSVLSRVLVDENLQCATPSIFKDGDKGPTTCTSALAALLHQLLTQDPTGRLIDRAKSAYQQAGKNMSKAPGQLWKLLLDCAEAPEVGEIICLIDALDECQEQERRILIDLLKGFYGDEKRFANIPNPKFLVTSRPYDKIKHPFRALLTLVHHPVYIPFHGSDKIDAISRETHFVIDEKVCQLTGRFTQDVRTKISNRLKDMHDTSYPCLHLVFQIIEDSPTDYSRPSNLESLLRDLPTEVVAAYEKILNKACNSNNRRKMELLFEILLDADEPLCIEAVDHALIIALRETEVESMRAVQEDTWGDSFEQTLGNLTGFLVIASTKNVAISPHVVVCEPNATVAFSHQTVQEFLIHEEFNGGWQGRFQYSQANRTILSVCFRALGKPNVSESFNYYPRRSSPLFEYAALKWTVHYNALNLQDKWIHYEDVVKIISEGPQLKYILRHLTVNGRPSRELHEHFRELGMACCWV
ncbi:NACHT and ankyrin domain protein [Colletotrichum musicola]|uniref:NACHT and ankyrin domain protein n=1 Tax=Colletotrichum musicola TaxID=2175873 RepID=A0A8H6JMK8_9PEZI|nr:NACHT and ankyrin domain protein [Colletotrichum musicola]